ncbi:uncharacterized protein BDZ99DRAFT_29755 [Mytilinidion resinicola]|uniref:Uncharacterized protein n=1 Tax=Mytilinidion resinicola TaxID=574789 RepID=A0A6A6YND0_9PEZI|nr:uncharacterized protein BDZ99DRAFT_29755 [Mytilinidion resinicola]KAF2809514.1 hypothetical protein BDZ99DRAFT_29755 [Mytilinidion resinicola]
MGGRLSVPRSADGISEVPGVPGGAKKVARRSLINGRTLVAPLAALTMAGLLFVYSRTSIRAAKLNAQKHREADGGQISWYRESRRRHGQLEKVDDTGILKEALFAKEKPDKPVEEGKVKRTSENEETLRKILKRDD